MERKRILKSLITNASYNDVLSTICQLGKARTSSYVCICSVHMLIEAWQDETFNQILNNATIVTPDGKPVSVLMNLLYGTKQERIAGPDLMVDVFARGQEEGLSLYFYGATDDVLQKLRHKLEQDFPALKIAGMVSPPFRALSDEELAEDVCRINDSGANIVLVALGCPKQERWMARHAGSVNAVMLGVGAAFPFYTGDLPRAPLWMQKICIEWLFRLMQEPKRLFKRYLVTNSLFLWLAFRQFLSRRELPT